MAIIPAPPQTYEAWSLMLMHAAQQIAQGGPYEPLVVPIEGIDDQYIRDVLKWAVHIATDGKQGKDMGADDVLESAPEGFVTVLRQLVEYIRNSVQDGRTRTPKRIQMPVHGHATVHRTRRMVEDAVKKHRIPLNLVDKHKLTEWHPESLSLNALLVLLACVAKLTEDDALPDLRIRDSDSIADSIARVTVRFPDGYSELADYASFPRTRTNGKGPRHDPNTFDAIQEGIRELTQPRDMYHAWSEWNPKKKRNEKRMRRVLAPIAELVTDSRERRDEQGHKVFQPHAQYIALHPFVLIGAREHFADLPGDLRERIRGALGELTERGKEDPELRALVGSRIRINAPDLRFLLWCYMHRGQGQVAILDDKLMDQLGLTPLVESRNRGKAEKALRRALEVARQDGVLVDVKRTDKAGAAVYMLRKDAPQLGSGAEQEKG